MTRMGTPSGPYGAESLPALPLREWKDTRDTLHMWTQIVGKVRMALSPRLNHWWGVPLYVNARGLTTSPIPFEAGVFEIQFDFIGHALVIQTSGGGVKTIRLVSRSVADFYDDVMAALRSLGIVVKIWTMPVEVPDPVRFEKDRLHSSYDPEYANRFWRVLLFGDAILKEFRGRFIGKASPVHFFWGSLDLAASRFSGRRAPDRPGADATTREAYSHEVISAGFWPGTGETDAAFYCYAAPEPSGFSKAQVRPNFARYSSEFSNHLLMYEDLRTASSPKDVLLDFLQSTYEAGATLGKWDRQALEAPRSSPKVVP
jgi:hypothetical protein